MRLNCRLLCGTKRIRSRRIESFILRRKMKRFYYFAGINTTKKGFGEVDDLHRIRAGKGSLRRFFALIWENPISHENPV